MKKILSFRPSVKIAHAVLIASILVISCEKQALTPKPTDYFINSENSLASFNAKLKIGSKDGIDVLATGCGTTTDSTKTTTP